MKRPIPFGKYYLLERVNVGGMAEVFKAKAFGVEGFERLVAIKRILPNIAEDEEFISMFIDEAKIAVQLTHANIAQVFDLGRIDDSYFIALEYVSGRDLRAIFDRCRQMGEPMPIAQACFATMKVCEGLDYAHNKRDPQGREMHLVHRDVSPQNVLVSFEGEVKLIDFGIAKAIGKATQTQAGILKGKFGYMSPEQVRGLPIDRRSDVFSVGIVLYELLTNERLFVGESDFSTLEKVRNVEILPPTAYNRKIPEELERIVLKALAKDVEDRYQNAIDLHDELQAFVYTAGEFCSRKDLTAWMKKVWVQELAEENAKLEQFHDLKAPPPEPAPAAPHQAPARPSRQTRAPVVTAPAMPAGRAAVNGGRNGRAPPPPAAGAGAVAARAQPQLEWDDEELETHVYGDQVPPGMLDDAPAEPEPEPLSMDDILTSTSQVSPAPPAPTTPPPAARPIGAIVQPVAAFSAPSMPSSAPPAAWGGNGAVAGLAAGGSLQPMSAPATSGAPPLVPYTGQPGAPTLLERPSPIAGMPDPSVVRAIASQPIAARPMMMPPQAVAPPERRRSSAAMLFIAAAAAVIMGGGGTFAYLYLHKAPLGRLTLTSEPPGADVLVNGSPAAGNGTPVQLSLAAGRYLIAVQKTGYKTWDEQIDVKAGADVKLDTVRLDPLAPTGLVVSTEPPGAKVTIDGTARGVSPLHIDDIAPGHHTVVVDGVAGYDESSRDVDVQPGQDNHLNLVLTATTPVAPVASAPQATRPAPPAPEETRRVASNSDREGASPRVRQPSQSGGPGDELSLDSPLPPRATHPVRPVVPPAPPPAPPAVAQSGRLKVSVIPASDIFVDGKEVGWSPLVVSLPAGDHRVEGKTLAGQHWGPFPVTVPGGGSYMFKKEIGQ